MHTDLELTSCITTSGSSTGSKTYTCFFFLFLGGGGGLSEDCGKAKVLDEVFRSVPVPLCSEALTSKIAYKMQHINRERESSLGFPDLLIFFLKKDKAISIMVLILKYEHQGSSESSLSPDVSEHPTTPVQNA